MSDISTQVGNTWRLSRSSGIPFFRWRVRLVCSQRYIQCLGFLLFYIFSCVTVLNNCAITRRITKQLVIWRSNTGVNDCNTRQFHQRRGCLETSSLRTKASSDVGKHSCLRACSIAVSWQWLMVFTYTTYWLAYLYKKRLTCEFNCEDNTHALIGPIDRLHLRRLPAQDLLTRFSNTWCYTFTFASKWT